MQKAKKRVFSVTAVLLAVLVALTALLPTAGLGMVCILLGLWIGTRLSRKMSGDVARQVVYIGVGVTGLVTLVQELLK